MSDGRNIEQRAAATIPHRRRSARAWNAGRRGFLLAGLAAPALSACSLRTVDMLTPTGGHGREQDVAYGPAARQRLDIYRPAEPIAGGAPVIVFFYGGSWRRGSKAYYRFVGEYLARMGCVAMVADYRLYPEVRFPAFVEDGAGAVAWAQAHAARVGGDPRRVFAMGHSAGAHIAVLLGLEPRYLTRVSGEPGALAGVIGISGPYAIDLRGIRWLRETFPEAESAGEARPLDKVRAGAPPMLLAHGGQDVLVDPRNSTALARRLEELGNRVELRLYERSGHADILLGLSSMLAGDLALGGDVMRFVTAG
jgi:acetyl esterase/lipase